MQMRTVHDRLARVSVALACALAAAVADADGSAGGRLAVWAIGLPHGYVVMEDQTPTLHITAEDVARGVVEIPAASRFAITTHAPVGYMVDFVAARGSLCEQVVVEGMGSPARLGPRGGTVVQRDAAAGRRTVTLNYRCTLAAGASPGSYPWPLEMVVREIAPGDYGPHRDDDSRRFSGTNQDHTRRRVSARH